jgi:hypothetical protein
MLWVWLGLSCFAYADFKQWSVSLSPTYAITYVDARTPSGGGTAAEVGFGITEGLSIKAAGVLSWHPVSATPSSAAGTLGAFAGMIGISYSLDVIRIVPSFDVLFGVIGLRGDAGFSSSMSANQVAPASTAFGIALGLGVDYWITRWLGVGLVVRYHAFITDLTRIPVYLFVGPRITFSWGR